MFTCCGITTAFVKYSGFTYCNWICPTCNKCYEYNYITDTIEVKDPAMANSGPFININKFQRTFNFTCKDPKCKHKQIVYATTISQGTPVTYAFKCDACKAEYLYNFQTRKIDYDPSWVKSQSVPFTTFKYAPNYQAQAQYNYYKGNQWSPKLPLKTLAEGYYLLEVDKKITALKDPWTLDELLRNHGINKDINTKRFSTGNSIIFLQLPVDFHLFKLYEDMKAVTSQNYVGIYLSWCLKNSTPPIKHDELIELFKHCERNDEYALILELIMTSNLKNPKDLKDALIQRLRIRLELFNRVPSGTNMLLAYQLIEEVTLKNFEESKIDLSDEITRQIERFDKCKNLACGTKFIEERKTAFMQSLKIFKKITKIEII